MIFRSRAHASDADLSAYIDGQLSGRVHERVSGHLDGCSICQQALEELRAVRASLQALPRAPAPRSFALREAQVTPRQPGGAFTAMPLLSGVAAMALIAFFAVVGVDMGIGGGWSSGSGSTAARPASFSQVPAAPGAAESSDASGVLRTAVTEQAFFTGNIAGTPMQPTRAPAAITPESGGSDTGLHVVEAALAAVALVSGGSAVAVLRRRAR